MDQALALVGVSPERVIFLGFDGRRASYNMRTIAFNLADLLASHRPDIVVTHPYEGGHPDHDATCFGVHMACKLLAGERKFKCNMTTFLPSKNRAERCRLAFRQKRVISKSQLFLAPKTVTLRYIGTAKLGSCGVTGLHV